MLAVEGEALVDHYRAEYAWDGQRQGAATALAAALGPGRAAPDAVAHRIVHCGRVREPAAPLDAAVERRIEAWSLQAPAHNARALSLVAAVRERLPGVPSFAAFDSAFHGDRSAASMRYALPASLVEEFGLWRYGFHGHAHESLRDSAARALGCPPGEVTAVTLQLGSGCSACAIENGRSVETSMGFSPLEGLVMATRAGDVDPGVLLHLLRAGLSGTDIEEQLARRGGLKALGGTADMRELLARAPVDPAAGLALDVFVRRVVLTVGGYFTLLGGRGVLVFGGGIGANSPEIRRRVADGLQAWGVAVDPGRNPAAEGGLISTADGRPVFAFRTDEEAVIARHVHRLLVREER